LGFISVALALTAQFYPAPFPDNYYILIVCCSTYFVCSSILQYIATFKEKDFVLSAFIDAQNQIHIKSTLPRYDYTYTITMRSDSGEEIKLSKLFSSWFDVDGVLHEDLFLQDIKKMHEQFNKIRGKKSN